MPMQAVHWLLPQLGPGPVVHDWRSHIVFEVTPLGREPLLLTHVITVTPGKLLSGV